MIIFLTTADHTYTHAALARFSDRLSARSLAYATAFGVSRLPRATYVFTDCDRLPAKALVAAAALYRSLRDAGARVLNDPARIPSRYGLLRLLHESGVNRFDAYRYEERRRPLRWPIFLRTEGDHDKPISDLLQNWEALQAAAEQAIAAGIPMASILIVEYCAEPVQPGVFRKLSSYRVGDQCFAYSCVHDDNWLVKYGKLGVASAEMYDDEFRIARENPYADVLHKVFEAAHVEYGRVDYGLVGGEPQIYEINTNPHIAFPTEHASATRMQTYEITAQNYLTALTAVDTAGAGDIAIESPVLKPYQEANARARAQGVARRLPR